MATKIGEYGCYHNPSDMKAKIEKFNTFTHSCLNEKVQNLITKGLHSVASVTIHDLNPEKSEIWLRCWHKVLVETQISASYECTLHSLRSGELTIDDLQPQARANM